MLEMTSEEAQAVKRVWEDRGHGITPIPEEKAGEILAEVRTRTAQIEAQAYRLGNSIFAEGRRTPRREERKAVIFFAILVIVVIALCAIPQLLR